MTFDLWPADSEFELDLYFSIIYLHIQNIKNPSNIFEVIVRKPIWIHNELWPLTFDLRTPNSNLTCILVSSTDTSKILKIRPTFLKLLRGNQFGGRTDGRPDRRTDGQGQRIMPPRDFVCGGIKTPQNVKENDQRTLFMWCMANTNPKCKHFTWRNLTLNIALRLDYFMTDKHFLCNVLSCDVRPLMKYNHNAVSFNLAFRYSGKGSRLPET